MIRTIILAFGLMIGGHHLAFAQYPFLDYHPVLSHHLDRVHIQNVDRFEIHSSVRYQDPSLFADSYADTLLKMNTIDEYYRDQYMSWRGDIWSVKRPSHQGLWGLLYDHSYHAIDIKSSDFQVTIDPIVTFSWGDESDNDRWIFQNTRGIKAQGNIDDKVYFYTSIYENQRSFMRHVQLRINRWDAIPGQGFYKRYQSSIIDDLSGWDYLNAQAYLGMKISKSIDLQFGYGDHHIGNGIRSMLLSDYSHNYLYLKLSTKIGPILYQNIFAELAPISDVVNPGDDLLPKKYMAAHYLDWQINSRFSLGLYEVVIFGRENHFEFQYLNPVILYRSVEQLLNSPDNVLIGLNSNWIIGDQTELYGQLMIDEMRTDEIFSGDGWWGNKIAYQLGIKHINLLGVDNLDVQIEYNSARPYTYTHRRTNPDSEFIASYSHYHQALAHPLGANFREFLLQLQYPLRANTTLYLRYMNTAYGEAYSRNVGNDILLDYDTRENDYGNNTTQGVPTTVSLLSLKISHELFPNIFIDLDIVNRSQSSDLPRDQYGSWYGGVGIRANMFNQNLDY